MDVWIVMAEIGNDYCEIDNWDEVVAVFKSKELAIEFVKSYKIPSCYITEKIIVDEYIDEYTERRVSSKHEFCSLHIDRWALQGGDIE